jgi:Tfp pilus assembly protein PilN
MIKINLVPIKEKKKRQEFFIVFCVVAALVLVISGMLLVYAKRKAVVNDLNKQIMDVDKEAESYKKEEDEIDAFNAQKDSLEAIKKTIMGISEIQRKVLVGIDQLALNLPDGVWLTKIDQGNDNNENQFTIQGYAVSVAKIENYLSNLQHPGSLLKEATFDEKNVAASVSTNARIKVHQFTISFKVADPST